MGYFFRKAMIGFVTTGLLLTMNNGIANGEVIKSNQKEIQMTSDSEVKKITKVKGIQFCQERKSKTKLRDTISVSPANGRKVYLQLQENGTWKTVKTFRTERKEKAIVKLVYPNSWWDMKKTKWRICIDETKEDAPFCSKTITVHTKRFYQNPKGMYQIQEKIPVRDGSYNLSEGYMGLKVRKVNRYFGISNENWPRYSSTTAACVRNFQKKNNLSVTGVVDEKTWTKMGFSDSEWKNLGAYVSPVKVKLSSSRKDCIEAMIQRGYEYLSSSYVVGASGTPKDGCDCSGFVMQALYAAGIDTYPISPVRHSHPGYEFESANLWASKKLKWVPYSQRQRGDLIFYQSANGSVMHIAIYLGNNKVIESWPNQVVVWPIQNSHRSNIKGVKRVFQ